MVPQLKLMQRSPQQNSLSSHWYDSFNFRLFPVCFGDELTGDAQSAPKGQQVDWHRARTPAETGAACFFPM